MQEVNSIDETLDMNPRECAGLLTLNKCVNSTTGKSHSGSGLSGIDIPYDA